MTLTSDSWLKSFDLQISISGHTVTKWKKCGAFICSQTLSLKLTYQGDPENNDCLRRWLLILFSRSTGFLNMFSHNVVSTGCDKLPLYILCVFKMNGMIDNPADCEVSSISECPKFENCGNLPATERSVWWYCNEWKECEKMVRNVQQWAKKCAWWNSTRTPITHHSEHLA